MYEYIPVRTSRHKYILVWIGMCLDENVCTGMYLHVAVCTCMNQCILLPVSMYEYILVWTSIYQYILVHTSIYHYFLDRNSLLSRIWIQGDTRRYMAVQGGYLNVLYPCIVRYSEVQGNTWRYKALYRLVLPFSGVQDILVPTLYCHVPPCIALYPDTGQQGISV